MYGRKDLLVYLLVSYLAACTTVGSSDGNGNSTLPGSATAYYKITIHSGDTTAFADAIFSKGLATEVKFTAGESISVNGIALGEDLLLGASYNNDVPLVDPDDVYDFELKIPKKGTFSTPVPMLDSAQFTSPVQNQTFKVTDAVSIDWDGSDPEGNDEVDVDFDANGDGTSAHSTLKPSTGTTHLALSSTQLRSFYQRATGTVGGAAVGSISLKRANSRSLASPFHSGSTAEIEIELDKRAIRLVPQ